MIGQTTTPTPTPKVRDYHGRTIVSLPEEVILVDHPHRHKRYCARCGSRSYTGRRYPMDVEVYCSASCYQDGPTFGEPFDVVAVAKGKFEEFQVGSYEYLEHLLVDVTAPGAGATINASGVDMTMQHIGFDGLNEPPLR